ncbi:MAG TPA: hotdog domain-containing protein [Candidatus Kryptonia bacterium]
MKSGLDPGRKSSVTFKVEKKMVAAFEGKTVHEVLSTFHLVYYAELAARRLIEPFLEEHEEAVGFEISLKHIAPTRIGETVEMIAALTKMDGKRVTCTIEARNQKGKICEGTQTQILIRKGELY